MSQISVDELERILSNLEDPADTGFFSELINKFFEDQPKVAEFLQDSSAVLSQSAQNACVELSGILWKIYQSIGTIEIIESEELIEKIDEVKNLFSEVQSQCLLEIGDSSNNQIRNILFNSSSFPQPAILKFIAGSLFGDQPQPSLLPDHEKGLIYIIVRAIAEVYNDNLIRSHLSH